MQQGVGILFDPRIGDFAAGHIDDNQRLAGGLDGFQHLLLRLGQDQAGAVAAVEARIVDLHFFAFEIGRQADKGDDGVGRFGRVHRAVDQRVLGGHPVERRGAVVIGAHIVDAHAVRLGVVESDLQGFGRLGAHAGIAGRRRPAGDIGQLRADDQLVVDPHLDVGHGLAGPRRRHAEADLIDAGLGRGNDAGPAHREGLRLKARRRGMIEVEIDDGIGARQLGCAGKGRVVEILALEAMFGAVGRRTQEGLRHWHAHAVHERRTRSVDDMIGAEGLAHRVERQGRIDRRAGIVAFDRLQQGGIRADDGDAFAALERQGALIGKQDHSFLSGLQRQGAVFGRIDGAGRNGVVLVAVDQPHADARHHQSFQVGVDLALGDQALVDGVG